MVRNPVRSGLRVVALTLGVAVASAACGTEEAPPTATDSATETSADSSAPAETPSPDDPSETAAATATTTVFYVVDTRAGLRLAGEPHDVPDDPVTGAVEAMIAGPDDPDYATTWDPATQVLGVTRSGKAVTVDLSADARRANVGSEGAALMIQQLVYTVSEATTPKAKVRLLIEGEPAGELWGAVDWSGPVRRADPLEVRQLVQIDSPREGEEVSSPVTVSGVAATFEANVPWRVLDEEGTVVDKGFTTAEQAFTFAAYSFTVDLPPGSYTIEVSEDDPSGGEAGPPMKDTRTVTVS